MKVGVVGSRNYNHLVRVFERLYDFTKTEFGEVTIVSGGARGVDTEAVKAAKNLGLKWIEYKPDYQTHGDNATHIRNDTIIAEADKVIAFWNGERSRSGTWSVISKCLQRGRNLEVIFDE